MELINQELIITLFAFSKGWVALDDLKYWLAANVMELAQSPSPLDRMLLGELELALSEYDRGDRGEDYLKNLAAVLVKLPNPILLPHLQTLEALASVS